MEEKTLQEVLKENQERTRKMYEERKLKDKKEQRKTLIIVSVASVLILALTFKVMSDMTKGEIENCMKKGYSQTTCEYRVG